MGGYKGAVTSEWHEVCGFVRYILKKIYETTKKHFCSSRFLPFSLFMSWSCGKKASELICQLCTYMHAACLYRKMANTGTELMEQN